MPVLTAEILGVAALFEATAKFGGRRTGLALLPLPVYLFELQHVLAALRAQAYYPGLVSSLVLAAAGAWYAVSLFRHGGAARP